MSGSTPAKESHAQHDGKNSHGGNTTSLQRLALASLLSAVALVLSYLEAMIPLPVSVPGIKLGLANVSVAVALFVADAPTAAAVAVVKVLASGLLFGSPMMLAYSLGGTILSFLGMLLLSLVPGVGLVPVCMLGAILHNAGQLAVAALMLGTPSVFVNLPVLAIAACVTGSVTGAVAEAALGSLEGVADEDERPHVEGRLTLVPGERVAFVGPNGSGKTSFALQLMAQNSEMEQNSGGEVFHLEQNSGGAVSHGGTVCQSRVGMAFQDPDSQIVAPMVRDDVAFGLENQGVGRDEMLATVAEALECVGMQAYGSGEVSSLSGGEKQRVAIAGLLAMAPGVVIFDESTSMLDPVARERFSALVRDLTGRGIAVVQITQLMDEAFEAGRIVVFSEGKIVAIATPGELLQEPDLLERYDLELPHVAQLAQSLRGMGLDVPLTNSLDELEEALAC